MKVKNLQIKKSGKRVILEATLEFLSGREKDIFLSIPKEYSHFVSDSYDSFLASILVPCMKFKEDIVIVGEISSEFLASVRNVMLQLEKWNLGLSQVSIKANKVSKKEAKRLTKIKNSGLFFSGGVDSFYTFLKNKKEEKSKINHFIFVLGFDIRLEDKEMFAKVFRNIKTIAKKEGIKLIDVKTNIRDVLDKYTEWDYSHGSAMAFISMALRNGFSKIYISGGLEAEYAPKRPYGTHPELDPLWSTNDLRFIHIGTDATRMQKIMKYVSKSKVALKYLRVCWRGRKGQFNCGICEKCMRTMLSLYSAGVLHKCETLPKSIDKEILSNLVVPRKFFRYYEENLNYLKKNKSNDSLIPAIEKCLERNSNPNRFKLKVVEFKEFLGLLDARYLNRRFFYFLSKWVYI